MNAIKHMEAIFIAAAIAAGAFSYATVSEKPLDVAADSALLSENKAPMPVVTVAARRLTPAEKAALI